MPVNRNALIRYKTIDKCLRNRMRKWTLDDLIEACSDTLYEYEGIEKGVSRRTVQMDIQMMRSEKLGYNAPIEVVDRKFYRYADPEYSIEKIPLTTGELDLLGEAVEILRQFQGFSHFQEMEGMVKRLEDKVRFNRTGGRKVIDFERNEDLAGLEFLDPLYQAVLNGNPVTLVYQSFRAKSPNPMRLLPVLLKEFRNRWFVLGSNKPNGRIQTLALDRIQSLETHKEEVFGAHAHFDPDTWFENVVGVTVNTGDQPVEIIIWVAPHQVGYVRTKPFHPSQTIVSEDETGMVISLNLQLNYEIERDILGFGETLRVLAPEKLANRLKKRMEKGVASYNDPSPL